MASRDLTSAFIERRSATNRRRRASGGTTSSSNVAPFGKLKVVANSPNNYFGASLVCVCVFLVVRLV